MHHFNIYWIEEKFASHYYYKIDILYQFLNSYEEDRTRDDLVKQFNYVTKAFPVDMLQALIEHHASFYETKKIGPKKLSIYTMSQEVILHIEQRRLMIHCATLHDAEELLFPILRIFHPQLFIMDLSSEAFGWISPANHLKLKKRQLLYSQE